MSPAAAAAAAADAADAADSQKVCQLKKDRDRKRIESLSVFSLEMRETRKN